MSSGELTLVMIAKVPRSGRDAFDAYEAAVLALLPEHAGRLVERLRSEDGTQEVHLVTFPSRAAYATYRDDPRRLEHRPLLDASGAQVAVHELAGPATT